jgi:transcription antitermination factor NusA-like protein
MFEKEIPEVYDGTVEIVSIAREAGDRAKVIVKSNDANVDAIGTIVGPRGSRIRTLVDELHGENMDIIEWHDDRATLIKKRSKDKLQMSLSTKKQVKLLSYQMINYRWLLVNVDKRPFGGSRYQ